MCLLNMIWTSCLNQVIKKKMHYISEELFISLDSSWLTQKKLLYVMNAESGKKDLPQGKAHELASRYQVVNPKNMHVSNNI